MSDLPALEPQDFAAFFVAIHGHSPFPWQRRLAEKLDLDRWPNVLDLPTGCGKTAAIDVAVFQLALEAGRSQRKAALRIVYVVDRRTIVDQAFVRAKKVRDAISGATEGVLASVKLRLSSYSRTGTPLAVTLLRGAIARSDDWAKSPDQPLVAVSTVDQVGSRLLFRGYGVSDSMKPVHAGLLGNDVLYLLDEVHLSQPFQQTLGAIAGRYASWGEVVLPNRFTVVEMSATPAQADQGTFSLQQDDWDNEDLALRLRAAKPATLRLAAGAQFVREVESAVTPQVVPGATVAVVVNRVASARDIHGRLRIALPQAEVRLLTGRMRPLERQGLERELFPRLTSGRLRDAGQAPMVVVGTQCIEAGADFDFDALITECASLDALRQRFGRLNRMGELPSAPGVIVARSDTLEDDPVYGGALGATWQWLTSCVEANPSGVVDFGIAALRVPDDARELVAPRANAPVLLPSHLDAWVQTSPTPTPDPDIALWLHGPSRGAADVQVVWRADLSDKLLELAGSDEVTVREHAVELAIGAVEALPPASGEAMPVPFAAARRWLEGRPEPETFDVEGAREEPDDSWRDSVRDRQRPPRRAVAWLGDGSRVIEAAHLRPGQTIVVPASYGGIAHGTWTPGAEGVVEDLAEAAVFGQRGRAFLRLHPDVVAGAPLPASADEESDGPDDLERVIAWLADCEPPEPLQAIVTHLRDERRRISVERIECFDPRAESDPEAGVPTTSYLLVRARRRVRFDGGEVTTEDDRSSFTGKEVSLPAHLSGVGEFTRDFAERAGLPHEAVADIELAGRWHDVGKADPRFQRFLHGGSEFKALVAPELLGKSSVPMNARSARRDVQGRAGYPEGARHEVMSVALMSNAEAELRSRAHDWDLVLHLVASHHGRCRPLAPWVPDRSPVDVTWDYEGLALRGSSAHGLERLDSGVGERFWRLVDRYGWWGLAWMEAILRLGDHRRSEAEQMGESAT